MSAPLAPLQFRIRTSNHGSRTLPRHIDVDIPFSQHIHDAIREWNPKHMDGTNIEIVLERTDLHPHKPIKWSSAWLMHNPNGYTYLFDLNTLRDPSMYMLMEPPYPHPYANHQVSLSESPGHALQRLHGTIIPTEAGLYTPPAGIDFTYRERFTATVSPHFFLAMSAKTPPITMDGQHNPECFGILHYIASPRHFIPVGHMIYATPPTPHIIRSIPHKHSSAHARMEIIRELVDAPWPSIWTHVYQAWMYAYMPTHPSLHTPVYTTNVP